MSDPCVELRCRFCGCTKRPACPGGCTWVLPDLCSACLPEAATALLMEAQSAGHSIQINQLSLMSALAIIAYLQAALRHPANGGPSAELVEHFTRHLADILCAKCAAVDQADQTVRRLVDLGWPPSSGQAQQEDAPRIIVP